MDLMSRKDLQELVHVIFALHPERNVAECVLLDLCDTVDCLWHTQIQREAGRERRLSESYYKPAATRRSLLQAAAYLASEVWERDQESTEPIRRPLYSPTAEDLLVRYIKTLDWWAMERRVPYAVTALGCSLYTYTPHEMGQLVDWAANNIRRTHRNTLDRLQDRFPYLLRTTASQHNQVALRCPTPDERALVAQALACFAPWTSHLDLDRQPGVSLWESHFDTMATSEPKEWEQIHAVLDPQCAGLHRLICDYNSVLRDTSTMRLDPPDTRLRVPRLTPASSSGTSPKAADRFQPPPLSDDDLARLEYTLDHRRQRRQRMRPVRLSVYVDGREALHLPPQEMVDRVLTVPAYGSYIQVYGHDAEGPLLLAVFPLPEEDQAIVEGQQSLGVTPAAGQTITLTIQPLLTATGDLEQYRLQLTYEVTQARAGVPFHEYLVRWLSPLWHPPLAGEIVPATGPSKPEQIFYLDDGEIRVTCEWWAAYQDQPAIVRIAWQAHITLPGDFWVRFTQMDNPTAVLAEARLGSALEGEEVFTARALGFDPAREPWSLALLLKEPHR